MGGGIGSMKKSTALGGENICFQSLYAGIGHDNASPADLAAQADTWVRSTASACGDPVGLEAAEVFLVQKCLPGHFENMHEIMARMLGQAAPAPRIL